MTALQTKEESQWRNGHVSGCIYVGTNGIEQLMCTAYSKFVLTNPLHSSVFPSIRKFETELISMGVSILAPKELQEEVCGAITSGGTESILMALKAYRDSRPDIPFPEFVAPITIHPAFEKACAYFKIKMIHAPIGKDYKVDVAEMAKLITKNTVAIAGSAPNYPHGMIDPIEELAELAKKHKIGLHVDMCLGGFFLPFLAKSKKYGKDLPLFDFRVDGVTTISADLHKYGMAAKGTSLVLFRTPELRRSMYFAYTEWPGGIYASPTISGSRPGGLIAAAWAAVMFNGQKNYLEAAEGIRSVIDELAEGINAIPELCVIGDPLSMVIAWKSDEIDVFKLLDAMEGWDIGAQQKPNCLHLTITYRHACTAVAKPFLADLVQAVKNVKKDPSKYAKKAPMYGMASSMPDRGVIKDFAYRFIDCMLDIPEQT
eukprot:TRINITY_DN6781_c0_g1_i1.p1 TRINITY_DN6781_c0_g1~~TRINITY_DN6781_c0_g1_i1.p1  ORF type:complete len:491 (+),score=89.22 TRINITY_DN6781_c0_g1_i1:188-1474(+)